MREATANCPVAKGKEVTRVRVRFIHIIHRPPIFTTEKEKI